MNEENGILEEPNTENISTDAPPESSNKRGNGYLANRLNRNSRSGNKTYDDRINESRQKLEESKQRAATARENLQNTEGKSTFNRAKDKIENTKAQGDVLKNKAGLFRDELDKKLHPISAAKQATKQKIKKGIENKVNEKVKNKALALVLKNPYVLIGIACIVVIPLLVLFFVIVAYSFDSEASSNVTGSMSNGVSSVYSECNGVNVEGELYSLDDYIAGVVQHEAYLGEGEEALKAQAIAARTYALNKTDGCTKAIANSQSAQTFYKNPTEPAKKASKDTAGMVLTYNGNIFLSEYDSFCYADGDCPDSKRNADGSYTVTYKKLPNKEKHTITLSDSKQFGRIVSGGGHARGMSQLVSYQMAKAGKKYNEILGYFYSPGVQISSLTSENNSGGGVIGDEEGKHYTGTYTRNSTGRKYYNYKQTTYGGWIASAGCGLTSAAIIVNSTNRKVTPQYLYDNYRKKSNGVYLDTYFKDYSYSSDRIEKSVSSQKTKIINHLKNNGEAVFKVTSSCKINGESWTGKQHFFAVLDYNQSNNKIYVSNPGTVKESKNGWISIDSFNCATVSRLVKYQGG